jgi:hypothetical protein
MNFDNTKSRIRNMKVLRVQTVFGMCLFLDLWIRYVSQLPYPRLVQTSQKLDLSLQYRLPKV